MGLRRSVGISSLYNVVIMSATVPSLLPRGSTRKLSSGFISAPVLSSSKPIVFRLSALAQKGVYMTRP